MKPDAKIHSPSDETDERAAKREATSRVLKKISQGAEHELVVSISAADAMAELVPLLDRLLAIGEHAFAQGTDEGWEEAHERTLNAFALIRVSELRHAVGARMNQDPSPPTDKREAVILWLSTLRNLRASIQPDTVEAPRPEDVQYLQSLIDGTTDPLSHEVFPRLEPMFFRYAEGSATYALLERAAVVFGNAAEAFSIKVAAMPSLSLPEAIICAMSEARDAADDAAQEAEERRQGGFAICGWAELYLTLERDSALWTAFFEASALPQAQEVFRIESSGDNRFELSFVDLWLPAQGAAVQAAAMEAALLVLKRELPVTGYVSTIID